MKLLVALTALSCGADAFSVSQKYVQSIPSFDSTTTQLHSRQPIMVRTVCYYIDVGFYYLIQN